MQVLQLCSIEVAKVVFIPSTYVVFRVLGSLGQYVVKFNLGIDLPEHGTKGLPFQPPRADFRLQMMWVDALARETDLVLQNPIRNSDGDVVTAVHIEGLDEWVDCVVCTWLPGRVYCNTWGDHPWPSPKYMGQIGRFTATMHSHMQAWTLPEGYARPRAGWQPHLQKAFDVLAKEPFVCALSKTDYGLLENGVRKAKGVMDRLGTDRRHFGLIHGDLCRSNLILHMGQILPIDFGNAAFGYYFGDMTQLFSTSRIKSDSFRPRLRAFIEGYRDIRQLPDNHVQIISTMFMVWGISSMANDLLYAKELRVEEVKLPRALWVAARYLEGLNFLDI